MPKEALSRRLPTTDTEPQGRRDSGAYPKYNRNPYSDDELLGTGPLKRDSRRPSNDTERVYVEEIGNEELVPISKSEYGRLKALEQAQEIAKDFPGLVIDNQERAELSAKISKRRDLLEDRERILKEDSAEFVNLRTKLLGKKAVHEQSLAKKGVSASSEERRAVQAELQKVMEQETRLYAYPTAEDEIEQRLGELREKSENTRNELTKKGIDAKIAKLVRLQMLLEKAQSYQHPEDRQAEEAEETRRRAHDENMARVRAYEANKPRKEQESPRKERPSLNLEPNEEQVKTWRSERKANEERTAREAARAPYKEEKARQQAILEDIGEKLSGMGVIVDLPWQVKNFKLPAETFFSRAGEGITSFFKGFGRSSKDESYGSLMKRYREAASRYVKAKEALDQI